MRIRNLFTRMRERNGINATISRGGQSCPCVIRLGQNANHADTNDAVAVEANSQDVFCAAADYKPTGNVSEPQEDDRISFTNLQGSAVVLRVLIPTGSEQCFQPCDIEATGTAASHEEVLTEVFSLCRTPLSR